MKLTLDEVRQILENEAVWHIDNPDKKLTDDFQLGFISGLRQAKLVLSRAEKKVVQQSRKNIIRPIPPTRAPDL